LVVDVRARAVGVSIVSEPNLIQTAFRLPVGLIKRVDRHARRLSERTGLNVTRADAVRVLLDTALSVEEHKTNGKRR